MEAAFLGAKEIGFTVMSISISLVAVFIPILLMGGIVGRLFREFAVTLSVAIGMSLVISLTTTPVMCSRLLKAKADAKPPGRLFRASERAFEAILSGYEHSLRWVLRHQPLTFAVTLATMAATVYLYARVPKGFFPQQDTGRLTGAIQADQDTSFQAMQDILRKMMKIIGADPAVDSVEGFTGGGITNTARMFISLKPIEVRKVGADQIMLRLRPKLAQIPGATTYLQPSQDLRIGGRGSSSLYQFTMRGDNIKDLMRFGPRMLAALRRIPIITDVNTDQQNNGLQTVVKYDRRTAARFGISPQLLDNTLYDAFGQRQVSTMYKGQN
jgi:multidrug efflux pump